ncbi:MAG: hypothetical protein C4308_02405 [Chitinophagaceae bacterium]
MGAEQQYTKNNGWGADRRTVADQFFNEFQGTYTTIVPAGNFLSENFLQSYFGRLTYDFKKKYYLQFNGRRDGFSAFAEGRKFGNFFGGSAGWYLSEEGFYKNSSIANTISTIKFRGSYGEVGNIQGIDNYGSYSLYSSGLYGADPTIFFAQAGNPELTWETSKKN